MKGKYQTDAICYAALPDMPFNTGSDIDNLTLICGFNIHQNHIQIDAKWLVLIFAINAFAGDSAIIEQSYTAIEIQYILRAI